MAKVFVFGLPDGHAKAADGETPEVRISAPSIDEARDLFARSVSPNGFHRRKEANGAYETNCRDKRLYITRVDDVGAVVPPVKRPKKPRARA